MRDMIDPIYDATNLPGRLTDFDKLIFFLFSPRYEKMREKKRRRQKNNSWLPSLPPPNAAISRMSYFLSPAVLFFPGHQKGLSGWWREKENDDDDSALFRPKLDSPMLHEMYPKYAFGLFSKKNYWKKLKISLSKSNVEFRFFSSSHPCFLDLITSASFVLFPVPFRVCV